VKGDAKVTLDTCLLRQHGNVEQWLQTGVGTRGEPQYTWTTVYANEPIGFEVLTGRELELARQMAPNASHKITMRWKQNVAVVTWRIVFNGESFTVGNVNNVEYRNRKLILTCYSEVSP